MCFFRAGGIALCGVFIVACGKSAPPAESPVSLFQAPAGELATTTSATIEGQSGAILPSGRFVTPAGTEINVLAPKPMGMAMAPDGSAVITVNNMGTNPQGVFPFSATLITGLDGAAPVTTKVDLDATYLGAVFSTDGARFYVSGGDDGNVWVGDTGSRQIVGSVNLSGADRAFPGPIDPAAVVPPAPLGAYPGKMALSPDGRYLYVVDQGAFKLHVVDTQQIQTSAGGAIAEPNNFAAVLASVPTGHYPYAVAVSADGSRVFVANVGIFRYTHLLPEAPTGDPAQDYPLCYPGAGYPEETLADRVIKIKPVDLAALPSSLRDPQGIRCGYVTQERDYTVPAAGDPNAPESSSVYVFNVSDPAAPARIAVTPTGARIGQLHDDIATYGASHPNSIVVGPQAVYVANGNHDTISVLHPSTFAEVTRIDLEVLPGADGVMKGVLPVEMALSPDGVRLYVAEAGINAIGVIELGVAGGLDGQARLAGHIPAGWWPSAVNVSPDGLRLFVANSKGRGAGPSSGTASTPIGRPAAVGPKNSTLGTVNVVPVPNAAQLAVYTAQVYRNNGLVAAQVQAGGPIPAVFGQRSGQIRHVVLINKENATFDLLLGHVTQTRRGEAVAGDPGNSVGVAIAPNHTELALQFALSDNFFLEPVSSSDGHRWLAGMYATEYQEAHWPAAYGQKRRDSGEDPDVIQNFPGRIAFSGANESAEPIDYNMHGGVFLHLTRNGRTVMNFGNGIELAQVDEGAGLEPTGARQRVNIPIEKVLRDNSDHLYANFNMHIPDSPLPNDPDRYSRFGRFKQVFENLLVSGDQCLLPHYTTLFLPNDHGGLPTDVESSNPWSFERFVQDNDAALGLAVELISNSPCWKDTVIFVLEDDTQNGVDHVDGHRTILLTISPWARREHVSHVHASIPSVFKTIYLLLGVPPLNQYDEVATDLREMFTATPDYTPYAFQPVTFVQTASAQTRAWQLATRNVDFSEMDGDEVNLRAAIIQALGLPRREARPLHETHPQAYALHRLDRLLASLRRYGGDAR